ncbi:MAG: polyphenol oxidase family protein [Propionibacteriaceae bacterium]|jgi:YfiH family protein|nr:polyphenol oxidase family protein [Propionibacteriaceae bacterium]
MDPGQNHGVGVAFTTRHGGVSPAPFDSLNVCDLPQANPFEVKTNLELIRAALRLRALVGVHQLHSAEVLTVPPGVGVNGSLARADALVTAAAGVGLLIKVGDCVPVLLADPGRRVVGAAHAGRVGLLAGVLPNTVEALRDLGARELVAWIGPHVCPLCYEVPEDMAEAAWEALPATRAASRHGTPAIDLGEGAAAQLAELGVTVHRLDPCTAENSDLFSHRRDGDQSGRLGAIVWM